MKEESTGKGVKVNRSQLLTAEFTVLVLMVILLCLTLGMAHVTRRNHYFDISEYLNNRLGEVVYQTVFTDDERTRWDAAIQEIGQEQQKRLAEFTTKLNTDKDFQNEIAAYYKEYDDKIAKATTEEEKDQLDDEKMLGFINKYILGGLDDAEVESILNKHGFYKENNRSKEIDRYIASVIFKSTGKES